MAAARAGAGVPILQDCLCETDADQTDRVGLAPLAGTDQDLPSKHSSTCCSRRRRSDRVATPPHFWPLLVAA